MESTERIPIACGRTDRKPASKTAMVAAQADNAAAAPSKQQPPASTASRTRSKRIKRQHTLCASSPPKREHSPSCTYVPSLCTCASRDRVAIDAIRMQVIQRFAFDPIASAFRRCPRASCSCLGLYMCMHPIARQLQAEESNAIDVVSRKRNERSQTVLRREAWSSSSIELWRACACAALLSQLMMSKNPMMMRMTEMNLRKMLVRSCCTRWRDCGVSKGRHARSQSCCQDTERHFWAPARRRAN